MAPTRTPADARRRIVLFVVVAQIPITLLYFLALRADVGAAPSCGGQACSAWHPVTLGALVLLIALWVASAGSLLIGYLRPASPVRTSHRFRLGCLSAWSLIGFPLLWCIACFFVTLPPCFPC